jgi:aconitate hydratase
MAGIADALKAGQDIHAQFEGLSAPIRLRHALSARQIGILVAGGAINWRRECQSLDGGDSHKGVEP